MRATGINWIPGASKGVIGKGKLIQALVKIGREENIRICRRRWWGVWQSPDPYVINQHFCGFIKESLFVVVGSDGDGMEACRKYTYWNRHWDSPCGLSWAAVPVPYYPGQDFRAVHSD
jgi:hypothetical protein